MITREEVVEQSVTDFVRGELVAIGYPDSDVKIRETFPTATERASEMEVTTVAVGFNFDDGGRPVEMGSDLTLRIYNIEFWTFGLTPEFGRNVANVIKHVVESNGLLIPLRDIRVKDDPPVIDQLIVMEDRGVRVQRQIPRDPRPWDANVYTTTLRVEDYYYPSAWA